MKTQQYLVALFCAAALALFGQTAPSLADKRVALVIGNGVYAHTPALANPDNDAADVAQALAGVGFDVTLKLDVDKRQMDQVVAQFARTAKTADSALFFYAGHGMQFEGKNFLMPVDAELQDEVSLRYEMIALDDVKAALQLSPGVKIMILDACRDNPLADKLVRSIRVATRDIPKVQGYARPEKAQGMIIVYATQADDVAQDGQGRNSPFSQAFLKEIKEPGLEVGTMFRRIGADVYTATDGRQSPELSISMVPEYYLNQSETDQTIWARIREHADKATLQEFLDRYPNSFYAPDARARLDLVEREARENAGRDASARREADEQAARERAAAEASARASELEAKLASAEAERQKLAQELTRSAADQAAAEARTRSELERLKERGSEAEVEKASAERERALNEQQARELQSRTAKESALKEQIALLEQQVDQAKASAQAETRKAEDARNAAAEAAKVKTASLEPVPGAAGGLSAEERALVGPIETELRRVGCFSGVDGDWDSPSVRLSVAEFARYAKLATTPTAPDGALLDSLKGVRERVCPPLCSAREVLVNGTCVAKTCPRGEILSRDGRCSARPVAARATAPREVDRGAARPATRGHCFSFNGSQYCE